MKINRLSRAMLMALALNVTFNPPARASGFPVVDIASNAQKLIEWTKHMAEWMETAQHYKNQIQAYRDQLEQGAEQLAAQTGIRDVEGLLKDTRGLANDLRKMQNNGVDINKLLNGTASQGNLDAIYKKYQSFDACSKTASEAVAEVCKKQIVNKAVALENSARMEKAIIESMDEMDEYSRRIENAKDAKESQDIANALNAKSIKLNAQLAVWEMQTKQAEQRDRLMEDQKERAFRQSQKDAKLVDFNAFFKSL